MMNKYYVYALYDPRNGQPFYVGKGKAKRAFNHLTQENTAKENSRKYNIIKKIRKLGLEPYVFFISENMTEKDAYDLEEKTIKFWGKLREGGLLTNICDDNRPPSRKGIIDERLIKEEIAYNNSPLKCRICETPITYKQWKQNSKKITYCSKVCADFSRRGGIGPRKGCKSSQESVDKGIETRKRNNKPVTKESRILAIETLKKTVEKRKGLKKQKYMEAPKHCEHCDEIISYEKWSIHKKLKFCNHICQAASRVGKPNPGGTKHLNNPEVVTRRSET